MLEFLASLAMGISLTACVFLLCFSVHGLLEMLIRDAVRAEFRNQEERREERERLQRERDERQRDHEERMRQLRATH